MFACRSGPMVDTGDKKDEKCFNVIDSLDPLFTLHMHCTSRLIVACTLQLVPWPSSSEVKEREGETR